ncbi:hypothetical protein DFS33DRAFT_130628 [Desarmillaria ectypa]|nr:hypothetical protein DFS33DRAFT_130628 [Desarmillaria ectypa]
MFYSTIPLFFSALFFTATARGACHPNFEGAALTVGAWNGELAWTADPYVSAPVVISPHPSKFFFQQNGDDPDVTYTVKTVANNNYGVKINGTRLYMDTVDWLGTDVNKKWKVECATCATDISQKKGVVATGCAIASAANRLCVSAGDRNGAQLALAPCASYGSEQFQFVV